MSTEKVKDSDKPFRVSHDNGDVVKGFDDQHSAEADAVDRNQRARDYGISARYAASAK